MGNQETDLKAAIIAAVNMTGMAEVWNSPAGKVQTRHGSWIVMAPKGTADVSGYLYDGRALYLEVKTERGKTDKERAVLQKAFRDRANARGCVAAEVRSVDEAVEVVRAAMEKQAA